MPDKYRRYGNGGGVMGLSDRVKKQVRRDVNRGGPDSEGGGIRSRLGRMWERRKERAQELEDILAANPDRHLWPQHEALDRDIPYSGTADRPFISALTEEIGREGRFSLPSFMQAREERKGWQQADRPISLEDYRGKDWDTRTEHEKRWYREGRASGGIVGLQTGGVIRGYQQGGIPANYAAPQAYGGYGMPAQFSQRQEHLSPEVAQQYADLTRGIMQAGTRGYEDVRYRGPQLAGFTGMEAAAQAGAGAYGRGAGPQGTRQAASTLSQAAQGIGGVIPEQEALARQYGTMATGAKGLGTTAAEEQQRIAALMETSGTAAKATGTAAETAFEGLGTGIQTLADTSAIAERGYGTTADTLGQATEKLQRGYGTTVDTLGTAAAKAQRGYGTTADTLGQATEKLQRGYGTTAGTLGTAAAKAQRGYGTTAGTLGTAAAKAQREYGTTAGTLAETAALDQAKYGTTAGTSAEATAKAQRLAGTGVGTATTKAEKAMRKYGTDVGTAATTSVAQQRTQAQKDFATASAQRQRASGTAGQGLAGTSAAAQRALGTKLGDPTQLKGADLSPYMSQYTQGVTDPQLQQLMEFQKMQGQELRSQAAGAGAFGSLRQGVQAATQAQDVSQQAADIIGQNQQKAFEAARAAQIQDIASTRAGQQAQLSAEQSALGAERAGGLDVQTAEQAALAAETGAQTRSLTAEQAALQQQMEAQRFGSTQEQAAHQARIQSEQFGLGTEQAAHQAQLDAQRFGAGQGQVALQARMDAKRFGAGQEQAAQQTAMDAQRFGLSTEQAAHQTAMDAQRFGAGQEQAAYQARMDAERFGTGQEQAAHQTAMDAQRFGAGQEQAAYQARMDAERFGLSTEQGAHQTAVGGRQANLSAQQAALSAAQQGRSQYEGALTGAAGLADVGTGRELQGYGTAADMMGGQGRAMAAGLGAYGQLAGIGRDQMALGRDQQGQQIDRFDMMNRYGGQQRKVQQAGLDIAKAEHEKAMQYPERQIGWIGQQLGALPYQNIVSQSTYAPQQGPISTTLGAVAGGQEAAADWRANQPNAGQQPVAPIQHGAGGAPNQSLFPATGQPSGLGLSAGATGQPSGLGLSAGAPGAGFGAGATNTGFGAGATNTGFGAGAGGWPGAGQTAFGTTSQFPNINKFNAAGGMIGSYNTGGYLPYAGGGYMPYYGMAGGGYVPGIVGVGRGMGR